MIYVLFRNPVYDDMKRLMEAIYQYRAWAAFKEKLRGSRGIRAEKITTKDLPVLPTNRRLSMIRRAHNL